LILITILFTEGERMNEPRKIPGSLSIYIPKYDRNFLKICELYSKEIYKSTSFSGFILMCVKNYINNLSRKDKANFEEIAYKLAKKDKPKASEFVDRFIKEN